MDQTHLSDAVHDHDLSDEELDQVERAKICQTCVFCG